MADDRSVNSRSGVLDGIASIARHAAQTTLRPLSGAAGVAAEAGISVERRAVDRLLESGELERLLGSGQLQAILSQVLASDGAKGLVDSFFDGGLFDHFIERLLASDSLWHLVDEVAASPAVAAAISHQGLGFADQVGAEVRARSREGDDRLERIAHRLIHHHPKATEASPDASSS
jgi:hypothetical protein